MTQAGQPVSVGGIVIGPPVRVGGTSVGGPVVAPGTGGANTELDDLVDVDAPPAQPGVLERQGDGLVRPVARAALLAGHVDDTTPHPAYDDMPSLVLLFENGLV